MPIPVRYPGVYVQEIDESPHSIAPASTSVAAFVGRTPCGPVDSCVTCCSFADFERAYGGLAVDFPLGYAVRDFFRNGGAEAVIARLVEPLAAHDAVPAANGEAVVGAFESGGGYLSQATYLGDRDRQSGIYLLEKSSGFNLLCLPPDRRLLDTVPVADRDLPLAVRQAAAQYCTDRRAIFLADPPAEWQAHAEAGAIESISSNDLGLADGEIARNVAVYFPHLLEDDPLLPGEPRAFAPCGAVAGIIATTDKVRGVWKAPAGTNATLAGVTGLGVLLTDAQQALLNPLGINCLRDFAIVGDVIWGARTLRGADVYADDYKYLAVRRLVLFVEESLSLGMRWVVFEANDEALWSSLRLAVNSFLAELARQGAFFNYDVTCDATTTTPADIANGVVNLQVALATVKPAEFVVLQIQQRAQA